MLLTNCRVCSSRSLEKYISLGHQPPSDSFLSKAQLNGPIKSYPLNVVLCKECGLSQLDYVVDPVELYKNDYPYESSTTQKGREHYRKFAEHVVEKLNTPKGSKVIDIGSNVGVLLMGFKDVGMDVLGIDPANNIVEKANANGIPTECAFFDEKTAIDIAEEKGLLRGVEVITGTNVFAHVNDLHSFMRGIYAMLSDKGVFIFESPSLLKLLQNNAYSSIYHEHLSYLSLKPVQELLRQHDFEIFDVEEQDIHEGSFRVYICRKGSRPIQTSVYNYIIREELAGVYDINTLHDFGQASLEHLGELHRLIQSIRRERRTIALLSAPAKAMTIVNSLRLSVRDIFFASEKSPLKIGKYLPEGTIPVFDDKSLVELKPDYAIIGAWNFQDEIIKNNQEFTKNGGKFIQLFPEIRIL